MTRIPDNIWAAMTAAEDAYGEAEAGDDTEQASKWNLVADELHILHAINRQWVRP